jgi:ATP/ADP translocase
MTRRRGLHVAHVALSPAVIAPAAVLFAIMVAHALLETARDALFLARLGPDHLASAYLVMAGAALLAVGAVRRWGGVRDPRRVLIAFLVIAVAGTGVLAATIMMAPSVSFALYVWTGLVATLVVPSFWTMLDRSLRIAEAKRVFGAIGAGGVLGAMVGSAMASVLGRAFDAEHLVTAGAIAFGIALVAAIALAPRTAVDELPARRKRVAELSRRSRRYIRLLIVVGLVSTIVLTLGDLTFKRVLAERLAAGDLAMVFGAVYTTLNTIGLVVQLVITPKLLARWGVGAALTVLPLILVCSALGFALTGALIAVIALELGEGGLRHSLHRVGSEILYLPVPAAVRDGWKLIADAISLRGGQALAALLVFAVGAFGSSSRVLAAVTAIAGVGWLIAIVFVRGQYIAQFRDTLQAGEIQRDVGLPELDADSIALLAESLSSPDEVEALTALDLLARRARVPALVLYHPSEAVVRHALSLLEGDLRPDVARVLAHLIVRSDPQIRAAALAASSRIGRHHAELVAALDDADPNVRAAALVGLAGEPAHADVASSGIDALVIGTTADRVALATAIGYLPHARFRPALYEMLGRNEPAVMRHVLHVLEHVPALVDLERVLPLLEDARIRTDVRRVFVAVGRPGLDQLISALDDPRTPLGVRRHLPRTISRFRSRAAAAALVARLPHEPDGPTAFKILRALGRMRADDPHLTIDPAPVREYVRRVVGDAARYATLGDRLAIEVDASPGAGLISELLAEKRQSAIEHAFRALGILEPRAGLRSAHDALISNDEARRSAAREIVETVVPADVRAPLLAVLDEGSPERRRIQLGDLAAGPFTSYEAFVAALLADPSESLRCIVAHHVAERRLVALKADLARLRPEVGPQLVINAFDQAIASLDV